MPRGSLQLISEHTATYNGGNRGVAVAIAVAVAAAEDCAFIAHTAKSVTYNGGRGRGGAVAGAGAVAVDTGAGAVALAVAVALAGAGAYNSHTAASFFKSAANNTRASAKAEKCGVTTAAQGFSANNLSCC
jgi:hypothetical protein